MKLDVKALALSLGILWGASLIIMGIIAMIAPDYADNFVEAIGSKYPGYAPTIPGSIIGGVCGFFDMGIFGLILGLLYNKLAK